MDRAGAALEVGTVVALGIHNVAVNHLVPRPLDDLFNPLAAMGLVAGARRNGFEWDELGLSPHSLGAGALVGAVAGALSAATVASAAAMPRTRRFFHDERVGEVRRSEALYHAALRIPIATALSEEVLFRGVLAATLARRRSPLRTGVTSSILFGLWHVLPSLRIFRDSPGDRVGGKSGLGGAVASSVAGTAVAGGLFFWLRRRSNSVVAPFLAHAAINTSAFLIGRSVVRRHAAGVVHPGESS